MVAAPPLILLTNNDRIILSSGNTVFSVKHSKKTTQIVDKLVAPAWVRAACISPNNKSLAIGTNAKHVQIYQLDPFVLIASV